MAPRQQAVFERPVGVRAEGNVLVADGHLEAHGAEPLLVTDQLERRGKCVGGAVVFGLSGGAVWAQRSRCQWPLDRHQRLPIGLWKFIGRLREWSATAFGVNRSVRTENASAEVGSGVPGEPQARVKCCNTTTSVRTTYRATGQCARRALIDNITRSCRFFARFDRPDFVSFEVACAAWMSCCTPLGGKIERFLSCPLQQGSVFRDNTKAYAVTHRPRLADVQNRFAASSFVCPRHELSVCNG